MHWLGFEHAVFYRSAPVNDGPLHIYIAGDGTPWHDGRWPAVDPTPREPVIVGLIALDPAPAIVLGRPCYHGLNKEPSCRPALWTGARYSKRVVASMVTAASRWMRATGHAEALLIGYSGGGSLATLMAAQMPGVRAVVTIAANLDTTAWTRHHGYLPLAGSLNPRADLAALDDIAQWHFFGGADRNVPPALADSVAGAVGDGAVRVLPGFDHRCCWRRAWPRLLAGINRGLAGVCE